jgi:hypothetical protein
VGSSDYSSKLIGKKNTEKTLNNKIMTHHKKHPIHIKHINPSKSINWKTQI